jgi:enamine deaminase RidA (YjgF/YER057c/UK114 family)
VKTISLGPPVPSDDHDAADGGHEHEQRNTALPSSRLITPGPKVHSPLSSPRKGVPMEIVAHNPTDGIYPAVGDYVHALEVRGPGRILFVAGTMGLDSDGVAGATLTDQLELIWSNIRTILASADMTVENVVRVTSYLRDASYAEANAVARARELGGRLVPTTAIVVETLVSDWLVEIEVIAAG